MTHIAYASYEFLWTFSWLGNNNPHSHYIPEGILLDLLWVDDEFLIHIDNVLFRIFVDT